MDVRGNCLLGMWFPLIVGWCDQDYAAAEPMRIRVCDA
jgi:hypothetical protein